MKKNGKIVVIAVSVFALQSASVSENLAKIPTPEDRINFLIDLKNKGLSVILMLRPVYPEKIIPINELKMLLEKCGNNICVVSSGLGINDDILLRINKNREDFLYDENSNEYLNGAINCEIKFVDVKKELFKIEEKCRELSMPFFVHSMPALNYILQNTSFL